MKKPNPPNLVTVAVITTVAIIFWVFITVYSILTAKADVDVSQKLLEPINPTLDTETLQDIEGRVFFDPQDVTNPVFNVPEPTAAPSPEPTQIPTPPELDIETSTPSAFVTPPTSP